LLMLKRSAPHPRRPGRHQATARPARVHAGWREGAQVKAWLNDMNQP
jgi:hypothetical protein